MLRCKCLCNYFWLAEVSGWKKAKSYYIVRVVSGTFAHFDVVIRLLRWPNIEVEKFSLLKSHPSNICDQEDSEKKLFHEKFILIRLKILKTV